MPDMSFFESFANDAQGVPPSYQGSSAPSQSAQASAQWPSESRCASIFDGDVPAYRGGQMG